MLRVADSQFGFFGNFAIFGNRSRLLMPDPSSFTVGLIQMHCSPIPTTTFAGRWKKSARPPSRARRWSACRSFSARNISASVKTLRCSIWPSPFPAPPRKRSRLSPAKRKLASWFQCLSAARAGSITTRPSFLMPMAAPRASIARCTSLTIRFTTRSFTSLRAISASRPSTRNMAAWERSSAGTSGIPKARASRRLQGANILFYPTAIGWHPDEKAEFGAVQHDAWRTIQRAHAIANGVYVGVVNRVGHEFGDIRGNRARAKAWNSGADLFSAIPSDESSWKLRTTKKKS